MPLPRLSLKTLILLLAALAPPFCQSQEVVVHTRGGDVIHGTILIEDSNNLVLSNSWNPILILPLKEVESRQIEVRTNAAGVVIVPSEKRPAGLHEAEGATKDKKPAPAKEWLTEISLGSELERGASDHQTIYGRARLTYIHPYKEYPKQVFKSVLTYDAQYGKTDSTLSDNRMNGSSKLDADVSRKFYAYNLGEAGYDKVRLINFRYEEGPGAGYHWIQHTNFNVNLELGADYQVQDRADESSIDSFYYRFGQDLAWKITKQVNLAEKFEYFPKAGNSTDFRMRFETTLSYAILQNLSWNFTVADLYDTDTAVGVPNNDFQARTTLGVKF